jgi:hypothetical protein
MLEINNKLISLDILDVKFSCDLKQCKGNCCIYGDGGAPLETDEIEEIKNNYKKIQKYMSHQGIQEIEKQGFFTIDDDGDKVTPLVNNAACAYVTYENEITLCAIEKAYLNGEINFYKPISCHLYPIRLTEYKKFTAVNYHKWDICKSALKKGKQENIPLYESLKTPIIRKFGEEFYEQLKYAGENLKLER